MFKITMNLCACILTPESLFLNPILFMALCRARGLKHDSPASASCVWELQACATTAVLWTFLSSACTGSGQPTALACQHFHF